MNSHLQSKPTLFGCWFVGQGLVEAGFPGVDAFLLCHDDPETTSPPRPPEHLFTSQGLSCIFEGADADLQSPHQMINDLLLLLAGAASSRLPLRLLFFRGVVERPYTGLPMAVPLAAFGRWAVTVSGDLDALVDHLIGMVRLRTSADDESDSKDSEQGIDCLDDEPSFPSSAPGPDALAAYFGDTERRKRDAMALKHEKRLFGHAGRPGASCGIALTELQWVGEDQGQFDPSQPPTWATSGKAELVAGSKSVELVFDGVGLRFTSLVMSDTVLIKQRY
jgi:hypothetical protein